MLVKKKGEKSMRRTIKSKIPEFKNIKEEAKFWDTHSFTDFEDELKKVDVIFELDKPRDETIIVRVQKNIKERLNKLARAKGLNLSALARMWLLEKLEENLVRK